MGSLVENIAGRLTGERFPVAPGNRHQGIASLWRTDIKRMAKHGVITPQECQEWCQNHRLMEIAVNVGGRLADSDASIIRSWFP